MVKSILNIHENQPRNKRQKFTNISEVHSLYKDDTTMCSDEFFWQRSKAGQLWYLYIRHWRQNQCHSKAESMVKEVNKIQSDEVIPI